MKRQQTAERNAVIYARYSSHNQTEQSIEGQLRVCHEYAKREGYVVVGEYIDRAISGKTDDRPDFQRMISDSGKGVFKYVIVYRLDRFTRNRYDSAIYKHKLKKNGVKVLSAMENIGDNPEGVILEAVLEASAEYYSLELSQKVKRGMRESAMKGLYCTGTPPLGYKCVDGRLAIDETTAPFVKKAFEQYADGVPKTKIIEYLAASGLRNHNGNPYSPGALQTIFRNKKYLGIFNYCDIEIEGACPALVDQETFNKVQEQVARHRLSGGRNKAKTEYLLSGKLFCGYCGYSLVGCSSYGGRKGGKVFTYYQCRSRRNRLGCSKAHEKKEFLESFVVEQTVKYVLTPSRMDYIAEGVVDAYNQEFDNGKIKELEKRIAKLDRDLNKFIDMLLSAPKASHPKIYEKMENAQAMKDDLEVELSKLRIASKIRYTKAEIVAWLKTFCKGDLDNTEFKKRIIDTFVNSVYVYDDRIIVFYNIRGCKNVSPADMFNAAKNVPARSGKPASSAGKDEAHNMQALPAAPSGICISNSMDIRSERKVKRFNNRITVRRRFVKYEYGLCRRP